MGEATTEEAAVGKTASLDEARAEFRAEILAAGLLVDAGEPGLYARSGQFEDVVDGVGDLVTRSFRDIGGERLRFAPVFPRREFEKTDYIVSFPHLAGQIDTFQGSEADHRQLVSARANGDAWGERLSPAETMLVPAACHPLFERLTGTLPEGGRRFDLRGFCFRHEPSADPMRLQVFRQQEIVHVGHTADAKAFRDEMNVRQLAGLQGLGLDARVVAANDPFFGRTGRMLARNQLSDEAKLEVVVPIYGDLDEGTAVGSANNHGDHFGVTFGIENADGTPAASSCLGWGLERIALALIRTHGTAVGSWPTSVREALRLS